MKLFTTGLVDDNPVGQIVFAHGLGKVPEIVWPVVVCVGVDINVNFAVGDEIAWWNANQDGGNVAPSSQAGLASLVIADATNIYIVASGFFLADNWFLWDKLNGVMQVIPADYNNFRLKAYAIAL